MPRTNVYCTNIITSSLVALTKKIPLFLLFQMRNALSRSQKRSIYCTNIIPPSLFLSQNEFFFQFHNFERYKPKTLSYKFQVSHILYKYNSIFLCFFYKKKSFWNSIILNAPNQTHPLRIPKASRMLLKYNSNFSCFIYKTNCFQISKAPNHKRPLGIPEASSVLHKYKSTFLLSQNRFFFIQFSTLRSRNAPLKPRCARTRYIY